MANFEDIYAQAELDSQVDNYTRLLPNTSLPEREDVLGKALQLQKSAQTKLSGLAAKTNAGIITTNIESISQQLYKPAVLDTVLDADTMYLRGQKSTERLGGDPTRPKSPSGWIDAPETFHKGQPEDTKRVQDQMQRYGYKSKEDVYKAGETAKLEALYNLMGRPKGADGKEWTPGPIQYTPSTDGVIELGSKQNPLGLAVKAYHTGTTATGGRGVSYLESADGRINQNAALAEKGMVYDNSQSVDLGTMTPAKLYDQYERNHAPTSKTISGYNVRGGVKGDYATDKAFDQKMGRWVNTLGGEGALNSPKAIQSALLEHNEGRIPSKTIAHMSNAIYRETSKKGMDPTLLVASILHETGGLSSDVFKKNNNFGGVTWNDNMQGNSGMSKGSARPKSEGSHYVRFDSLDKAIEAQVKAWDKQKVATSRRGNQYTPAEQAWLSKVTKPEEQTFMESMVRAPQAAGAALTKSVYDFADTATELVTNLTARGAQALGADEDTVKYIDSLGLGTEEQKRSVINDIFSYDDTYNKAAMNDVGAHYDAAVKGVKLFNPESYKNIDVNELVSAFGSAFSSPESAAYSLGYLVPYLVGAPSKVALKTMSTEGQLATKAMQAVAKDTTMTSAQRASKLGEIRGSMSVADRSKFILVNHADALALSANMTNEQLEEVIARNGGDMPTLWKVGVTAAVNFAGAKLDMKAATDILSGKPLAEGFAEVLGTLGQTGAKKAAAKVAEYSTKLIGAGFEELGQEFLQSYGEAFNKVYGTKEMTDWEGNIREISALDAALSPEVRGEAAVGAIAGAAGGIHMATPTLTRDAMIDTIKSIRKTKPETQVTASEKADVAYTQEVNSRVAAQRTDINDVVDDVVLGETVDSVDQKAYGAKRDSLSTAFDAINDADDTEYAGPVFGSKRRAESYLSLVAESKAVNGTFDEAVERKMAKVAKAHGIEDERLQKIKNMATVEFEAVEGKRGYNSYFREMNNLMEDPKANAKKIEKLYAKVDTFLSTQEQALGIFEAAVQRAKDTMAAPSYQANPNKVKQETIKFPVGDGRKKEHTYGLSYSEAGIAQAEKVIAKKRQNMEGLKLVRDLAGKDATDNGVDLGGTASGFVVPTSSNAKVQHDRERDEAKYKRIGMTKAIVSEKSHKKWAEYAKYNKARVNASSYSKDDVVVIDTPLAIKNGKVDMSDTETKAVVGMIKAAKKAGATIVVETGTGTKLSSYKGVVAQLINDFGSGIKYRSAKVKEGKNTVTKFLPEEQATEEKAKAAKVTEAKKTKEKVNDVLFTSYLNTLDGEVTEFDDVAEAKKAYAEARKVALENFGDKDKMDAFLEGRKNKQVKAVAAALVQSAKEGGLLRVDSSTLVSEDVKDFNHHVIRAMAEDIANKFLAQYDGANEVLDVWKSEGMEKALEDADIKPQAVLKSLLEETGSSAKFGNKTLHSYVIRKQGDKPGESTTKHGVAGGRELTVEERKGGKTLPLNVAKYAAIKRTTVFNTLPVFALGQRVGMLVAEWKPAFSSFLPLGLDTDTSKGHSQEEYAMLNSPARGLLIEDGADGQVLNDNVLAAIATTMQESIKVNGYMLSDMYKNADDLKRVHGLQQTDVLSREAHHALNPLGLPWKMFGNDLGKNIAKQIGLARSKEGMSAVEEQQYDRLIADLGNMGILAGIAKGWFEVEKMPTSEYARLLEKVDEDIHDVDSRKEQSDVKFVRLADFDTVVEEAGTNWDAISEELPDVSTFRKEYSTTPLTDEQIERKLQSIRKDRTGMVPGEKAREAMIGQMKQAWKPSYTLIQEFLDNADSLKEHLGWVSDKKIEGLRFDQREIQVAVNRDIERTLEELSLLNTAMDAVEDPAEMRMYFEWFYSRNGRYMMDSNTINPQTGKQTDRFFVTPEEHETTYEVDTDTMTFTYKASGKSMPKGKGEKLTKAVKEILGDKLDVTENVLYSLAQAFGLKVDKDSAKGFNKSMRSLLELSKGKPEVVDGWKAEFYKEGEVKVDVGEEKPLTLELEHLGQAMQAFDFLKQWAEGKEITSSLSAETDAVTSGFGIKVAQMPVIGRWLRYALKVGIVPKALLNGEKSETITKYLEQDKAFLADHAGVIEKLRELGDDGVSMNELLAGGLLQDSYQTQGAQMVDIKLSRDHAELDKALGKYSKGNTVTKVRQAYHDLSKTWDTIVSVLPKHIEGEKVSSEIRSLFKSPFMTFNYSASIKNIRLALSNELADKLLDKMYAGGKEAESIFKALKFPAGYKLTDLQQDLTEMSSDMIKTHGNGGIKVREYLVGLMNVSYGHKLEAVLSTEFKEFIAVQDLTNSAFQAMYYAYDVELQEALKGVQEAKGFVTKEDVVKVQDGLRGLFPAIKGPFSNEENELVAIIGDKMVTPVDGVAVQTPIDKKFAGKHGLTQNGKPQESVKIWQVVKAFAAAVSAGSVVPVHYIDGANMGLTLNDAAKELGQEAPGMTSVHDATIGMLPLVGHDAKTYNKHFVELSQSYNMFDSIAQAMEKIAKHVTANEEKYKHAPKIASIKIDGEYATKMPIMEAMEAINENVQTKNGQIKEARQALKEVLDESGAYIMHMASTPDGVYHYEGSKRTDSSKGKKKQLAPQFKGKIILGNSGIGKSIATDTFSNVIDGDTLFMNAANKVLEKYKQSANKITSVKDMRSVFELWGEYSGKPALVKEAKRRRDEVYQLYADLAKAEAAKGNTVLSSSARQPLIDVADYVMVQEDASTIAKNRASGLRENQEEFSVDQAMNKIASFKEKTKGVKNKIVLAEGEYIADVLEKAQVKAKDVTIQDKLAAVGVSGKDLDAVMKELAKLDPAKVEETVDLIVSKKKMCK